MQVLERSIQALRDEADEVLHTQPADSAESKVRKAQSLVFVNVSLWEAIKETLAEFPPNDREDKRAIASLLRAYEQTVVAVISLADAVASKAHILRGIGHQQDALREVRGMILMPLARRMANADPDGRTAVQIRDQLLSRVEFSGGRPVITSEIALDFPSPLEPEPSM